MAPLLVQEVESEPDATGKLEMTPVEATLQRLLVDVAAYVDDSPMLPDFESNVKLPNELAHAKITLRFTGGWVRDKLLGVASHDIDVAINKMTGYQFGLRLKEYLEIPGNPENYGLEGVAANDKQSQKAGTSDKSKTVGGLHKIEANPEKSKHLETVTTRILGLDIDLVNLRKETYTEESRNPQMEFGTPEEDALRRDATVNAMFYNITTEQLEDFTGRGQEDMRKHILRTPLEPYQTFKDDPLRILRLIRFASKLNYTIEPTALSAMREAEVKDALRRKISRERIGIEVGKALRGPDPHEALRLIFELGLYETVFSDPTVEVTDHYAPETENWRTMIDFLKITLEADGPLARILMGDDEERFTAWQVASLVPYNDAPLPEPPEAGRKAPPPIASSVAREGIKSTNKICDVIASAVLSQAEIAGLVDHLDLQRRRPGKKVEGDDATARDVLGMAIRRWGASWRCKVVYAMLVEVAQQGDVALPAIERKYAAFVQHLRDLDILEAYTFKPLMDGKMLAKALNTPPGPWMKDALDVVMAYQLRNPDKANAEGAIAAVQFHRQVDSNGGELISSLVHHFLKLTVRPLFIKAKPTAVTDTGRKNTTTVLPKKITAESMDDTVNRPWKSDKDAYALDLLRWCVSALNEMLVEEVWPMVVPPLLTLVDDVETRHKQLGAELIKQLLEVTPPPLLSKTGLGEVFEEALMPCLTYLPTITPEAESITLLDAVYPALLALAEIRFPKAHPGSSKHTPEEVARRRIRFLDTIVRKGIIYGYTHCSNYPGVVSSLFGHLVALLNELGIESVKHLKYILPMLTETLSHPLADARVETLISATKALQSVILNGWPRMAVHRGEVLKGLAFCWLTVQEGQGEELARLKVEMRQTVEMLKAAVRKEVDFDSDCEMLMEAEPKLRVLFVDAGQ